MSSCMSKKKIVYFQGSQDFKNTSLNYEPIIQRDDILFINVSSMVAEAVIPFNLDSKDGTLSASGGFVEQKQTYLVDYNGNIDFPVIGSLSVAGYSINELKILLKNKLTPYVKDPVLNIRIMNFKVTVLGEVVKPGIVTSTSQRLTLLDALASSGDLTPYGKRDNILLIRDFQGLKTYNRIDITKADFVNSPFYYLDQNDMIYVEPRKAKIDSTTFGTNISTIISIVGFLLTTIILITR